MKKTLLSLAFVAMGVAAFAQKPAAGDKTAEVGLNFQTGTAPVSYSTPELRLRYFMSDDMAVRLRFGLGSTSNTYKQTFTTGGSSVEAEAKVNSGFSFSLTPGIEKHFAGTDRLSPFVGAQLGVSLTGGGTTEITNATSYAGGTFGGVASGDKAKNEAGSTFGLNLGLFMGADYYITDGVFIGGEFGLGLFGLTSTGEGTNSSTVGGTTTETKSGTSSSFDLFGVTSGNVRLGFKF